LPKVGKGFLHKIIIAILLIAFPWLILLLFKWEMPFWSFLGFTFLFVFGGVIPLFFTLILPKLKERANPKKRKTKSKGVNKEPKSFLSWVREKQIPISCLAIVFIYFGGVITLLASVGIVDIKGGPGKKENNKLPLTGLQSPKSPTAPLDIEQQILNEINAGIDGLQAAGVTFDSLSKKAEK
jgi:hypothetical protein